MNTTAPTGLLQQPRPFFMIFFVELWERFGYYGVQGILAVFFVKQLGFSQEQAFITFGAFAALVYGLISIGGYVGDHLLGTKRTLVLGAISAGYRLLYDRDVAAETAADLYRSRHHRRRQRFV